ncbi:MAG: fibronectin type III domain-containing protein [Gammaproteobacteria bacterium]|nr:fibronectin type III domain-containing protein [Gammaproteobacteria bacterium]
MLKQDSLFIHGRHSMAIVLSALVLVSGLSGCGNGLKGLADTPPTTTTTNEANFVGLWTLERQTTSDSCGYLSGAPTPYNASITNTNGSLTVTDPKGLYKGGVNAQGAFWSGQTQGAGYYETIAVDSVNIVNDSIVGWATIARRTNVGDTPGCATRYLFSGNRVSKTLPKIPQLQAVPYSDQAIRLNWADNSTNERAFRVVRYDPDILEDIVIAQLPANSTEYFDTGLQPNTSYKYKLAAINNAGVSPFSTEVSVTTKPAASGAPAAPTGLTATLLTTGTQISLKWNNNADSKTTFQILRSANNANFEQVAEVPAQVTTVVDTVPAPITPAGQSYFYRVYSHHNIKGNAATFASLAAIEGIHVPQVSAPGAPAIPVINNASVLGDGRILLGWQSTGASTARFRIERVTNSGATTTVIGWLNSDSREFIDVGLDLTGGLATGAYQFRVVAQNGLATDSPSALSSTVNFSNPTGLPALIPADLTLESLGATNVNLSWKINAAVGDVRTLQLERALGAGAFSKIAEFPPTVTGFVDYSVSGATDYHYRLRAHNAFGDASNASLVVDVATPSGPAPAPTNVAGYVDSANLTSMTITGNVPAAHNYRLYRSLDGGSSYTFAVDNAGTALPYVDTFTPFNPDAKIFYRMYAYKSGEITNHSSVVTFTGETPPYTLTVKTLNGLSITAGTASLAPQGNPAMTCAADSVCTFTFAAASTVTLTPSGGTFRGCDSFFGTSCTINVRSDRTVSLNNLIIIFPPPIIVIGPVPLPVFGP